MALSLARLFIYPVKSLAGIEVSEGRVTGRGLGHDRRFMVVDPEGRFVTQRELGAMAQLRPSLAGDDRLRIDAPTGDPLQLPLTPHEGPVRRVEVWHDSVEALDTGDVAGRFLERALGRPLRLVYMPDHAQRPVEARADAQVSFADAFPFLVLTQASLDDLNARLKAELPVERFRPNLVVGGLSLGSSEPYAEDRWRKLRVGETLLRLCKPCSRCVITTRDPATGAVEGPNPLKALARYRRLAGKVYFGQNALTDTPGTWLRVGDPVQVLEEGPPPRFQLS